MFKDAIHFSSFSVDDLAKAKDFYGNTLGIPITEREGMGLELTIAGKPMVFIYSKPDHAPATFTVLNFVVDDIDQAVSDLKAKGIKFEDLDLGNGAKTDESGIARGKAAGMGPDIAWFKDPAGNFLAVLQV